LVLDLIILSCERIIPKGTPIIYVPPDPERGGLSEFILPPNRIVLTELFTNKGTGTLMVRDFPPLQVVPELTQRDRQVRENLQEYMFGDGNW